MPAAQPGSVGAAPSGGEPGTAPKGDVTTSTFSHSSRDMHVTVEKPEDGYMCCLSMFARVPLAPDRLYELLIDPVECLRIFRSLKRVRHRRTLADDGRGNRTIEVDQTGAWRFLMFRGQFTVKMIVEQRAAERTISFRLAKPGVMKLFSGTWHIAPYDNRSLDELVNRHKPSALHRLQAGLRAVEHSLGLGGRHEESLVQLQQSLAPALRPPAALQRLLQRIAAKQITKIMSDLQDEVARMNAAESGGGSGRGKAAENGGGSKAADDGGERQQQQQQQGSKASEQQRDKKGRGKQQLAAHIGPLR